MAGCRQVDMSPAGPGWQKKPARENHGTESSRESHYMEAVKRKRIEYSSEQLLQGNREVIFVHTGHEYRLRHTSKGKLILTR
jgi:hemin uptake protein HemP